MQLRHSHCRGLAPFNASTQPTIFNLKDDLMQYGNNHKPWSITLLTTIALLTTNPSAGQTPNTDQANEPEKVEREIEETQVIGRRMGNFTEITQETKTLVEIPGSLGDPLAAIFSLPGILQDTNRGGQPAVRGSSPADNQFLVDFMPAGYVFHEFNTSVFHEAILQDFQLYSAGFGAGYSDVTGAVFDIRLRQPKKEPLAAIVDLSMLRSGLFLEGQVSENSAFYASGRVSLIHLFIPTPDEEDGLIIDELPRDNDYHLKYAWDINDNTSLTLAASGASDNAKATFTERADFVEVNPDFEGKAEINNGYHGQNAILEHRSNSGFDYKIGLGRLTNESHLSWGDNYYNDTDKTKDSIKAQIGIPLGSDHKLVLGSALHSTENVFSYDQILFVCTEFNSNCLLTRRERRTGSLPLKHRESTAYITDLWQATGKLNVELGWQWQHDNYTEQTFFNPRFALQYALNTAWTITSSYGRYNRFPDIETAVEGFGNPDIRSPRATHYTLGVAQELDNGWSWNLEAYNKKMSDLPLALNETEPDADKLYVSEVEGKAWGLDLLINKELTSKWYSWVALSLAKSQRTNTRTDTTIDYYLDTPIIFNWVINYAPSTRFNAGLHWTIRSGSADTPIIGLQENPYFEDSILPVYGEPFSDRYPTFSQLDVRFKWSRKLWGMDAEYVLDIINVLNQQNITDRSLDYDEINSVDDDVVLVESAGRGIIPAFGLRLKF
ncbi:TonB-dependent receptor plug domain-containing protein [Teredinibacter waterburyi]|uniref:TonB-dependent receptor plug domain-containing protein n=1 Tax=Teredinibacter waterburyi TaxID=1500538 RepID=UPI001FEA9F13|nr:TonB-dependent receptor [Teredinibacter waterburyi]